MDTVTPETTTIVTETPANEAPETPPPDTLPEEDSTARMAALIARQKAGLPLDPSAETPPGDGEGDGTPSETKPEGEEPKEGEAAQNDTPEIKQARKILAAANKREQRALQREQAAKAVEARAKEYDALLAEIETNPLALLKLGKYSGLREFLTKITDAGEPKEPTVEDRVSALERQRREREEHAALEQATQRVEASKKSVFTALDADTRFDRVTSTLGHSLVWQEIEAYYDQHGIVPDEIVYQIAGKVEKYLADEGMPTKRKAKAGAPKDSAAASRTLPNSMTSTSRPSSDGDDDLPMDGKARMAAILARYGKPSTPRT